MRKDNLIIAIAIILLLPVLSNAQRVSVSGNKLVVDGNQIFMNGANTPWNNWNDFGGNYVSSWWDAEFKRIKDAGGNSTRIWISCSGEVGLLIENDGTVTGATDKFWTDLDDMFLLAQKNKIYIKATLISFDHFKNTYATNNKWRNMINTDDKVTSFVDNYAVPFVKRYNDNAYLWAVDICNEIEWANQNTECGNIAWNRLQYLVARVASAIHENSQVLVTLGSAAIKWNSSKGEANYWSDAKLKARYNKENARLDFYSPHFYGWVVQWFGNFATDKTPAYYGIDDRPCVIGENPAKGVFDDSKNPALVVPASDMFLASYNNGWDGLMPWTSNGVDANGNLSDFKSGLKAFKDAHPALVDPALATGAGLYFNTNGKYIKKAYQSNPDQLVLELSKPGKVRVQLFNLQGQSVYNCFCEDQNLNISTVSFPAGAYFLVVHADGFSESRILILNK